MEIPAANSASTTQTGGSAPVFTHLHVHSQYSLLDGKSAVPELVDKARADGMRGIALTDHGNMFGVKEFFNYVEKINSKADPDSKFKPIIGCEMYVARESLTDRTDKSDKGYHLVVLAKNQTGYHNLIKLVSKSWTEGFYYHPRTDRTELEKHHEGLIILSACLGGEVPQLLIQDRIDEAEERILWFKNLFGEDYYLELQRHQTFKENANRDVYPLQVKVNEVLLAMARKHNIKIVATNDVHFANENDAEAHDRLICVSTNKRFDEDRMHYTKQEWLKTPAEMAAIFSDLPECLANTMEILDKVEFYTINHEPIMPNFDIPASFGSEEEYRSRITEQELFDEFTRDENGNEVLSREEAEKKIKRLGGYEKLYRIKFEADYLAKLTFEGAARLYGDPLPEEIAERLKFELHIMKTMGFPGYFLIVQDFINVARNELGVSVGPGRGSAAGSAAAYCLGITLVDPIKYDLLFERFLNPDRISLPDIDVDFDDDGRYKVLDYVTRKYGAEKVAHIITYQSMAAKSALKDVGRIMGLTVAETNRLAKGVPDRMPEINGKAPKPTLHNVRLYVPEFQDIEREANPITKEVIEYSEQLEGTVRGTGVHACGVIISRDDITDWVPVSMAEDADKNKLLTTQYEGSLIEDTGLIKMDFLGLRTLSIIRAALDNIREARGIEIDIEKIPLDDPATFELYRAGATTSTFQFESAGMQSSLRKLKPTKFEDLIAMNALYRPGPMDYIPSFIARKNGEEPIEYDIPIMKRYLEETYGITVYQEQVMLLSRLLAGFTRGESDVLRKAMGKKLKDKMEALKVKFMDGGQKNGHNPKTLEKIWADWEKFASYAFNKSHATCYSWVAYQTGYLKANYPAEYMAGVLSNNLSAADKLKKVMDECMRMGLDVKGPDINESRVDFGVSPSGQIRFGLGAIKGVGTNAVSAILRERKENGPFKDIYDFVERVNLSACNRSAIESLALAGAFDSFGVAREMFVFPMFDSTYADILVKYGQGVQNDKNSLQASLFDDLEPIETNKPPFPKFERWDRMRLLEEEKKLVTIYLSAHPLDDYYMELTYGCNTTCAGFEESMLPNREIRFGGLVTQAVTKLTKKGTQYGRVTIEDLTGSHELVFFSQDFQTFYPRFTVGKPVVVSGRVAEHKWRPGELEFRIERVSSMDDIRGQVANSISIRMDAANDDNLVLGKLKEFMLPDQPTTDARPGDLTIVFRGERGEVYRIHSRRKFNLNHDFVKVLEEFEIPFEIS